LKAAASAKNYLVRQQNPVLEPSLVWRRELKVKLWDSALLIDELSETHVAGYLLGPVGIGHALYEKPDTYVQLFAGKIVEVAN
jgi:hypothetical protein